jgi:hypothetical protein
LARGCGLGSGADLLDLDGEIGEEDGGERVAPRTEARDVFDLRLLLDSGLRLEDVLVDAQRKHAGADLWISVLSERGNRPREVHFVSSAKAGIGDVRRSQVLPHAAL